MLKNLKKFFGFTDFKNIQYKIIKYILSDKSTLVIMPTGSGKSLCYQFPATMKNGLTIVISPLIALMKNQVDFLNTRNIRAELLNSAIYKKKLEEIKEKILKGVIRILYIAPESFNKEKNIEFFKQVKIDLIAIDEAHCISEWGYNFRPEYRNIRIHIDKLGNIPIIALTATANPKVQKDILNNLNIPDSGVFKTSFLRKNLYYEVRPKVNQNKFLIDYLKKNQNKTGIIYCHSRKTVNELVVFLKKNSIKTIPYHAGLHNSQRTINQDTFLNIDGSIIVATIAFGMGIDKKNVRFVIHYDMPKSIDCYYQETGRAGRDNKASECILLYSEKDALKLEKYNRDKLVYEKIMAKFIIEEMKTFAKSSLCRRILLLYYFGEYNLNNCNNCDNCKNPKPEFNAKIHLKIILETIKSLKIFFDEAYIAHIIAGKFTHKIEFNKHDHYAIFGIGKKYGDIEFWKLLIRQALIYNFIQRNEDFLLEISKKGYEFLRNPHSLILKYTVENKYLNTSNNLNIEKIKPEKSYPHSKNRLSIIKQIDRKRDLEDLASSNSMTLIQLLREIEEICDNGIKLNLNYYIDNLISIERQNLFKTKLDKLPKFNNIDKLIKLFENELDEIEIRLLNIKLCKNSNNIYVKQ